MGLLMPSLPFLLPTARMVANEEIDKKRRKKGDLTVLQVPCVTGQL